MSSYCQLLTCYGQNIRVGIMIVADKEPSAFSALSLKRSTFNFHYSKLHQIEHSIWTIRIYIYLLIVEPRKFRLQCSQLRFAFVGMPPFMIIRHVIKIPDA